MRIFIFLFVIISIVAGFCKGDFQKRGQEMMMKGAMKGMEAKNKFDKFSKGG